ncbi:inositol monophosphatase family protein [Luedemannella helvata]|uniref:inositol monophosphatase family protein n=1 Tax=Luedemannella helvata TaxID=349315 RepID=UPI0031DCF9D4
MKQGVDSVPAGRTFAWELCDLAVAAAREAADLVRAQRAGGIGHVATKSTDTDVVTSADRAAERLITDRLRHARPADRILGEESGTHAGRSPVNWLVDPIDGTVNYVYGLGHYGVSIAAQVNGVTVAGVVRDIDSGAQWHAVRGGGAWRDDRRLTGSAVTDLGVALVATGFGYQPQRRARQGAVVAGLLPHIRDIRRFGSAALDLCLAAEGLVDAFYESGLNTWDFAAGGLIAEEAGLRVTGLAGAPAGADMVLAAPPALYGPLHERLAALDAAAG